MQVREPIAPQQDELLRSLQHDSFTYFIHKTNPANGLVLDKSRPGWPASIAAVGFAPAAYPFGVERGFMIREVGFGKLLCMPAYGMAQNLTLELIKRYSKVEGT